MRLRTLGASALVVALAVLGVPGVALASTSEALADTGGMTLTVELLGVPVDIAVTLDDIGHITEVAVSDPAFDETRSGEHRVRFLNGDDSTRIEVKARGHKLKSEVKTAGVDDIVGSHTWSADLFGTGTDTVVTFRVAKNAAGHPELQDVAVDASTLPPDATFEIKGPKHELEDDEAESKAKIEFFWNGFKMTLKIEAELHLDEAAEERPAKLKIELKGRDVQRLRNLALEDLVGDHAWTGRTCEGVPLEVTYSISDSGDLSFTDASVDGAPSDAFELKDKGHGFEIEFDGSDAEVRVELKQKDDGTWELKVKSKTTERCDHDDDDDDDDHGRHDDDDHDDDDDDDHGRGHDDDDDDDDGDHGHDDDHDDDDHEDD